MASATTPMTPTPSDDPTDPATGVHDPARLAAVRATNLLDSAAEPAFDRLTRLAVQLLGVPTAFFSLVDDTRDFYKSACGFGEPLATARELTGLTFCHYAIRSRGPLVIPDTAADPVYREVPTVRTLGVAAYVGVPIAVDGQVIGSFCVIDFVPHAWTARDIDVLVELAASAEREIGMRAAVVVAERLAAQLQAQTAELQAQHAELEMQAEELQATAVHLEERTEQAEASAAALAASEAHARHLADAMPVQVWTAQPDGGLDFVNAQAVRYFGVPVAQLLGDGWGAFLHPDDVPPTLACWTHARETGERYEVEFRLRAPDGTYRWHLARGIPEHDATGAVTGWVGTNTDIEAARAARAAAEDARRRTTAVLESISDAFFALDRGWRFTYVNDRAEEMLHRSRAELLGQSLWETFGPALGTTFEREYRRAMATGEPVAFESHYEPLAMWFEVRVYPGPEGLAVYFQDVSERRAAAAERERLLSAAETARRHAEDQQRLADAARRRAETAQNDAEVATRAKSEFLATMSHEIRTPINAVLGYADLLALGVGGPLTEQQRDYLDRLTSSGRHLLGLVNEVLDTARVESGRMTVARERADLAAAAEAALALVRPQAAARGLRLDVRCDVPSGTDFVGDEPRVRQIVVNLLANAVKFTDPVVGDAGAAGAAGGADVTVVCGAATADDCPPGTDPAAAASWLFVRVADTGIGIPADQLEAVFEPFVQVERGHTRTRGGSGLGLAISRRLARLMAGDLSAQSAPGQGSTFTLWLPAAAAEAPAQSPTGPIDAAAQEALHALSEWLAAHAEAVTAAFGNRVRHDARIPPARTLTEIDLRDHVSTYLIDIAKMLPNAAATDQPTGALQDGSDIQQLIADRHGAQRGRLGFTEAMIEREFDLFREVLTEVVRAEAPMAARPALDRGLAVLTSFLDAAERIARRGFRHATASLDGVG